MGICASAPERRFSEVQNSCSSKFEETNFKYVDQSSKAHVKHTNKLGSVDLDRSARAGAAFLLRPSMQYQGAPNHNPSVHLKRSSMVADTSMHKGHPSVTASGGDQLRKQHASCSASADSCVHKVPSVPSVFSSQPHLSAGSVGAADLNPSSSGKLRHRRLQDMESKGRHGSFHENAHVSFSPEPCSRLGPERDGSSHSAVGTPTGSLPRSASWVKSGSRQGSLGLDNVNLSSGLPCVDRVSGQCRPSSHLPGAHMPAGPTLQPEHDCKTDTGHTKKSFDSESIMLIAELSDHESGGFLDGDGRDPHDPDSVEHQSSLASMFDEDAAALTGCEPADAVRTSRGAPLNRAADEVSSWSESQQPPTHRLVYRHSTGGELKGHGQGFKHDAGSTRTACSHLSNAPSASSARSLQKSMNSSGHRPSRLGTPSPGTTPLHSGPQIPLLDGCEQDLRGSGRQSSRQSGTLRKQGQLATQDLEAMQMALELSAALGSPDAVPEADEPPCTNGPEVLPMAARNRDQQEAGPVMLGSPFKAPQAQELEVLDNSRVSPGSDVQSPSTTILRRQSSRLNRPPLNIRSPAKSGSINSQASSLPSPKPAQGCGPVISPKSSGEGLANSLHSLRSLGSQLFKPKPTNEPAQLRQESARGQARGPTGQQSSDPRLLLSHHRRKPGSSGDLDHAANSHAGMAVGSPPGRGPASSSAVDVPGRARNLDRGSASRDMPASLNQWAAGTGAPMGSSSAGPGCRQPRQQQPSQPFLSGSPGGLGNALGSPLVGARCSSYMELSRDADEVTALSYFSRGSMICQRQGSPAGVSNPVDPHRSASCHGGSAFYASHPQPVHVRPTSGSVHGGTAFTKCFSPPTTKVFSFPHAPPSSGSLPGGVAPPMFRRASVLSPTSSTGQSQGTRLGLASRSSTSPPPTSESVHGGTAFHAQAQGMQPKPKVMFASQHGGSLYKDYADKVQQHLANSHVYSVVSNSGGHARSVPQDIVKGHAEAVSGGHTTSAGEAHSGTSPGAVQFGYLERALSSPNSTVRFAGPTSPRLLTPFLPEWLDSSQRGALPH